MKSVINNGLTIKECIMGMVLIMHNETFSEKSFVHSQYVSEKLNRILDGSMNFHPNIVRALKERRKSRRKK